ncbi:MAG: DCC1-like thiol-disulfide oxidoreductase family protein [Pseudomonadota bacterium]
MIIDRPPYAYRQDPAVPPFDDQGPIVFIDGSCTLCSQSAKLLIRMDRAKEFRICPVQSPTGRAVLSHFGLAADDPTSWLYLHEGRAYGSMEAVIRAGTRLGGAGHALKVLRLLPRPAQDWLYRQVAQNRYRIFGRADLCSMPDPAVKARLMD